MAEFQFPEMNRTNRRRGPVREQYPDTPGGPDAWGIFRYRQPPARSMNTRQFSAHVTWFGKRAREYADSMHKKRSVRFAGHAIDEVIL